MHASLLYVNICMSLFWNCKYLHVIVVSMTFNASPRKVFCIVTYVLLETLLMSCTWCYYAWDRHASDHVDCMMLYQICCQTYWYICPTDCYHCSLTCYWQVLNFEASTVACTTVIPTLLLMICFAFYNCGTVDHYIIFIPSHEIVIAIQLQFSN